MIYQDFEKTIYEWLLAKHQANPDFTFSLRQKSSEGAERDIFIGRESYGYFATTFWHIPNSDSQSRIDTISLVFSTRNSLLYYHFEIAKDMSAHTRQNILASEFVQLLKQKLQPEFPRHKESTREIKVQGSKAGQDKPFGYVAIDDLLLDLEVDLVNFINIVDNTIREVKSNSPDFQANRITRRHFEQMQRSKDRRLARYVSSPATESSSNDTGESIERFLHPLNQILFGPPGTGKTYNSIKKAVEIASPSFNTNGSRTELKAEYDRLVEAGQVAFVTLHQSMSYEDFIEGIKPQTDEESGGVTYEIQPGLFKLMASKASRNLELAARGASAMPSQKASFEEAWSDLIARINQSLEEGRSFRLPTITNKQFQVSAITDKGNIKLMPLEAGQREYIVSYARSQKLFNAFDDIQAISNIDQAFRGVIGGSNASAYWSVLNDLKAVQSTSEMIEAEPRKNFVLIIDEINRGNVSQIFGELITLIEESKRSGREEAIRVTLPYSKESFTVPENLYLIGTMNTADRSVEALDTALRRRFSFEETPPTYELEELDYEVTTQGFTANQLLKLLNNRLERLLDKDHLIGHSFFIKKPEEVVPAKLMDAFYRNIIPLLQEYFYGDYGKIGLVLGSGFVQMKTSENYQIFAQFNDYEQSIDERPVYEIIDYRQTDDAEGFAEAINLLIGRR